jgi:HSP20 family protein
MEKQQQDKDKDKDQGKVDVTLGLGGIFKGLGSLLEMASELAQKAEKLQSETGEGMRVGSIGSPKGLHAVYGVSMRVGLGGQPILEKFGNVREKAGKGPVVDEVREPIVDLLDEEGYYSVVAELPGMEESAVHWKLKDDILVISGESADRKYYKELLLPARVDESRISGAYKNGILELKLWKQSSP